MAHGHDTMMTPSIEELIGRTESKFVLVTLAAMRSREITNYLGQLGGGIGAAVPPQVISTAVKPLSIALEEIAAGKIEMIEVDPEAELGDLAGADETTDPLSEGSQLVGVDNPDGAHLQDVSDPEGPRQTSES
ncbi:MAG: DNA-directed RNA polymerase subunit omega [Acidimicrobiaceae bacterium]|nr:DNA-directed RNA polymerase subunit omega [Acidimicrobiaceae bacterium]MCY4175253.1 DNA-directed RNA polymerase subunit omega [Acidimicrobiaceae bacterium]MCY4280989.1 DNA-directed RNA polymerase subunit omega [Acidimicrobiaceae bacterium]MCY4294919.1 DNA-directed RNA polymerase subunit omega [Acidimicrobiaceae bacterium]